MPRKKTAAAAVPGDAAPAAPAAFQGACPACKSKITVNHHGNAVLHEKSSYLEELLETDSGVDEIEKHVAALKKQIVDRDAAIADLKGQLAEKSKPAAPAPQKENANVGQQEQKRQSWWD